jgi:uncharacterized protein (TIGR00255 family)
MISSMTGFGSADGQLDEITYVVEIATVNNRYFKARIKLPDPIAFLEEDIEKLLLKRLSRGSVNYTLRLKNVPANKLFAIDETALRTYAEKLKSIASATETKQAIDISNLLALPGIIAPVIPEREEAERVKKKVLEVTGNAIEKLKEMRLAEGAALEADMEGYCKSIKQDLEKLRTRRSTVPLDYQKKLKTKVDNLLSSANIKLDEDTLAREVAIFAERSDISEEIARLDSHLDRFTESCRTDGQAGRRLDFISQEMLREANTIGSKASDSEIIHIVVDIKCWIDRIKEQVQNIE